MALFGAVIGPVALAWGLQRTSGAGASLMLTLEAVFTAVLAWVFGEPLPSLWQAAALLMVGATGYGLSLRFYLLAQRAFGAARTGSVFAFAPFVGAALAFVLGDRSGSAWMLTGTALMIDGILLHLAERHAHEHDHGRV
jgi:drug/metabolite transporter (DMT)-like permease